jgi:hypothetical protein
MHCQPVGGTVPDVLEKFSFRKKVCAEPGTTADSATNASPVIRNRRDPLPALTR